MYTLNNYASFSLKNVPATVKIKKTWPQSSQNCLLIHKMFSDIRIILFPAIYHWAKAKEEHSSPRDLVGNTRYSCKTRVYGRDTF